MRLIAKILTIIWMLGVPAAVRADDLESALAGAMSVHGSFDEAALCSNIPVGCTVENNRIMLSYWEQGTSVFGRSASTIRYKPYKQCREWSLRSYIYPYCGGFDEATTMSGSAEGEVVLKAEIWDGSACIPLTKRFVIEGSWQARINGAVATGVLEVEMDGDTSRIPFTADIMPTYERMRGQEECPAEDPACEPVRLFKQGVFGRKDSAQYVSACGSRG